MLDSLNLWLVVVIGFLMLVVLVLSANKTVEKVIGIANYFKLSGTFMGMTVLSFATSIPEISSHYIASIQILRGTLDYRIGSAIVLGSNIGSDVVQQTLIMGILVLIAGSLYFRKYVLTKNMIPMIVTTIMCLILGMDGSFSRIDGAILFLTFIAYSYYLYKDERKFFKEADNSIQSESMEGKIPASLKEVLKDTLVTLGLLLIVILAASIVLNVTEIVVQRTGVGGSLIGVLTLGLASALPELTTALAGLRHKEHGISLGTLIGSNITNPLVAIGGGAIISTYAAPRPLLLWDLPWETLTGAILWFILWRNHGKLGKKEGIYLVVMYFVYIIFRAVFFHTDY